MHAYFTTQHTKRHRTIKILVGERLRQSSPFLVQTIFNTRGTPPKRRTASHSNLPNIDARGHRRSADPSFSCFFCQVFYHRTDPLMFLVGQAQIMDHLRRHLPHTESQIDASVTFAEREHFKLTGSRHEASNGSAHTTINRNHQDPGRVKCTAIVPHYRPTVQNGPPGPTVRHMRPYNGVINNIQTFQSQDINQRWYSDMA